MSASIWHAIGLFTDFVGQALNVCAWISSYPCDDQGGHSAAPGPMASFPLFPVPVFSVFKSHWLTQIETVRRHQMTGTSLGQTDLPFLGAVEKPPASFQTEPTKFREENKLYANDVANDIEVQ